MRIDSHQHFWDLSRGDYDWLTPDLSEIYRDFGPADLEPYLATNKIDGTVVVQATDTEAETEYLLSLADKFDWILGVVGWVDMEKSTAPAQIAEFAEHPKFVGIRPMIQGLADDAWMLRPTLEPAISALIEHNLCFDALVLPKHLVHLKPFLARHPDLKVVIDHGAKPNMKSDQFQPWADQMASIAQKSSAYCKLSGLVTEAASGWIDDDIVPYARHVLGSFGPERTMFGSDWPVVNLAGSYDAWAQAAAQFCSHLEPKDVSSVFGLTATNFYGLLMRLNARK